MEKFHTLKCLQQEAVRLKTFRGWSKTSIKAEDLAKCGFYFLHYMDYTQCFFCRGIVGCWDTSDVPHVEHERHFPNCPFVKSPDTTGNIPMDSSPLSNLMEEFLNFKLEYHKPPFPKLTSNSTRDRTHSEDGMRLPQYSTPKSRHDSFTSARKGIFRDHASMVSAGFFYSGVADFVVCFHCGGGLFNWSPSDDPWEKHGQAYSFCTYLALHRENWQPQPQRQTVPLRSPKLSQQEMNVLMTAPIVKRILRLGLEAGLVNGALTEMVEERAVLPVSVNEALELVSKWDSKYQMDVDEVCYDEATTIMDDCVQPRHMLVKHQELSPIKTSNLDEPERPSNRQFLSKPQMRDSNPTNQPSSSPAPEFRAVVAQSHASNSLRNIHQVPQPSIFNSSGVASAAVMSAVKLEKNEVEVMDSVSPRSFYCEIIGTQEPSHSSSLMSLYSTAPVKKQGASSIEAKSTRSTSEIRNQLDTLQSHYIVSQQDDLTRTMAKEVGVHSQQTATNDRIRQLQSELHALKKSQQPTHQQPQFPALSSTRYNKEITHIEIQELVTAVMELRRRVQEVKQRHLCRSCAGGARASVMLLPCNHLHLCRVCSVVRLSCPTCRSTIRGTVLPIREGLIP